MRDPEQLAARLIERANGKYDHAKPLVKRFAALSCEIERLHARIMALPDGAPEMAALIAKALEAGAESKQLHEMLSGPGRPLPMA